MTAITRQCIAQPANGIQVYSAPHLTSDHGHSSCLADLQCALMQLSCKQPQRVRHTKNNKHKNKKSKTTNSGKRSIPSEGSGVLR